MKEIRLARIVGLRFETFRRDYPEDWYQTVALSAFICHAEKLQGIAALRKIDQEFRIAMHQYGYYQPEVAGHLVMGWCRWGMVPEGAIAAKVGDFEECAVKWCSGRAVHYNEHLGKICHRHYACVRKRAKNGWAIPHYKIEFAGVPDGPPKKNCEFWKIVFHALTRREWVFIWLWAKGYKDSLPQKIIEKARHAVLDNLRS